LVRSFVAIRKRRANFIDRAEMKERSLAILVKSANTLPLLFSNLV
jgi:hypothetical protein